MKTWHPLNIAIIIEYQIQYWFLKYLVIGIPAKKMFHSNIKICSVVDSYSHVAIKRYEKNL